MQHLSKMTLRLATSSMACLSMLDEEMVWESIPEIQVPRTLGRLAEVRVGAPTLKALRVQADGELYRTATNQQDWIIMSTVSLS